MIIWKNELEGDLNGVSFEVLRKDYDKFQTNSEKLFVLKSKKWFDFYEKLIAGSSWNENFTNQFFNVVELGIFEGGSTLLFADMFPLARILAIDLRSENPAVQKHVDRMNFNSRVRLKWNCSQSDQQKITEALKDYFGALPELHLVVDDASHKYEQSVASFELLFPYLVPGGAYIVEDWGWAHWPGVGFDHWSGISLSSLILELTMACASQPEMFARIEIHPTFAVFIKGSSAKSHQPLDLKRLVKMAPRVWSPPTLVGKYDS